MPTNFAPLDAQLFVDRLAAMPGPLLLIDRAVDNATAIEEGPQVTPSAFVLEPNYRAVGSPNAGGGLIIQCLHWEIPVMSVVRHYGDPQGKKASDASRAVRWAIWDALFGWDPTGDGFTVQAKSGRMVRHKNACFYFVDTFHLTAFPRNRETYP